MRLAEGILKFLNGIISLAVGIALICVGAFSVYTIWDARQVYQHVDDTFAALQEYRPTVSEKQEDSTPGFRELQDINPDVCAWLTLTGTAIDYPVLQGRTNLIYLSADAFGNFSLAGSIFLDSRNDREARDPYLLVYGHHMEDHRMFGDLDLFLDNAFFETQTGGEYLTPQSSYRVEPFLCLKAKETEERFFNPELASRSLPEVLAEAESRAISRDEPLLEEVKTAVQENNGESPLLLVLATCTEGEREDRILLISALRPLQAVREQHG